MGKNLTSFTCFDNYQNQLFEQPIRIFAKSLNIKPNLLDSTQRYIQKGFWLTILLLMNGTANQNQI